MGGQLIKVEKEVVSEEDCAICMVKLRGEQEVSSLRQCGHQFHHGCIVRWLRIKKTCPLDRRPIP